MSSLSRSLPPVERAVVSQECSFSTILFGPTSELAHINSPPIGANIIPTAKKSGRTVFGVRMGLQNTVDQYPEPSMGFSRTSPYCHAFNRCCLNAVSALLSACLSSQVHFHSDPLVALRLYDILGGLLLFSFFFGSSAFGSFRSIELALPGCSRDVSDILTVAGASAL